MFAGGVSRMQINARAVGIAVATDIPPVIQKVSTRSINYGGLFKMPCAPQTIGISNSPQKTYRYFQFDVLNLSM